MEVLAFRPARPGGPLYTREFVLCSLCRNVSAEAVASTDGFKWHAKGTFLRESASRCTLCRYVDDGWRKVPAQYDGKPSSSTFDDAHSLLNIQNMRIKVMPGDPGPQHGLELKILYSLLSTHGFPVINKNLTNTNSAETFDFIRNCLSECASSHDCTSPLVGKHHRGNGLNVSPARLLDMTPSPDIPSTGESTIRLVEVGDTSPEYITLSHCWGKTIDSGHITTTSNINSRKSSIIVNDLPLNFRHAIQITRRLQVRYLWIDSLCIIQDSAEDWRTESVKMGAIYQGSFLTISANMGGDSTCGCFNHKSETRDQIPRFKFGGEQLIEITTQNEEDKATTVYFLKQGTFITPYPLDSSPLSERGWIYQERILSPRTLHFTPTQLLWECRRMYRMEDLMPTPYSDDTSPTTSALLSKTYIVSVDNLVDVWHGEIVWGDYSKRSFTKPEDKLIAIAGVAQIIQQHLGCDYLAGLWEDYLAHGLAFWLTGSRNLGPEPRRPTWAWSSHDKGVMWWGVNSNFTPDQHFQLVEKALEYSGDDSNPFNPVRGGSITIEAVSVSFAITHQPASDFSPLELSMGELEGKCRIDYPWRFRGTGKFPQRLEAILLGHTNVEAMSFLLVVESDQDHKAHRRIGYAHIYFPSQEERDAYWLANSQVKQRWRLY
ncbi:hypothetical protein PG999_007801 [Apiospora kogelbergensis]|uniref:Heterokaryon incompatibility domain-containing protein n=1 Tax=Apiospora kogelbergensis TaxID=1337665 RepID=A0AAW0QNY4_9PEZI